MPTSAAGPVATATMAPPPTRTTPEHAGPDRRPPRHGATGAGCRAARSDDAARAGPAATRTDAGQIAQDRLAGFLGRLEVGRRSDRSPPRTADLDRATAAAHVRIGEVDAVVAHAPGELEHLVLHLRIDLRRGTSRRLAQERPAGLEGRLHLLRRRALPADRSPPCRRPRPDRACRCRSRACSGRTRAGPSPDRATRTATPRRGRASPAPGDWSVATPDGAAPPLQAARTVIRRSPAAPARMRVRVIGWSPRMGSLMTRCTWRP